MSENKNDFSLFTENCIPSKIVCWFYLTDGKAPTGWVICNGKYYSSDGSQSSSTQTSTCTIATPNLIDKYAVGSTSDIGNEVEAGLPDIVGTIASLQNGGVNTTGAFSTDNVISTSYYDGSGAGQGFEYDFKASDGTINTSGNRITSSNSPYGKSNTVTPPSTKLLPCMKL